LKTFGGQRSLRSFYFRFGEESRDEARFKPAARGRSSVKISCHETLHGGVFVVESGHMSERAVEALINSAPETVQAVAAAAAPSFDEAFTLHHRAVFRAAYALVRDSGLAEDVTQEVFLKLHQHIGSLQNEEHVRPWLLRVASNMALNLIRSRGRTGSREEEFWTAATTTVGGASTVGVEADYERRTEIEEARRALGQVKEPMRSCLLLKQQGLSYREIAQTLSLKEANVGSLIARGRKEFMRVYGKIGGRR
jgi:RNA polymerase sigma-70 factor (ECF subfamily)